MKTQPRYSNLPLLLVVLSVLGFAVLIRFRVEILAVAEFLTFPPVVALLQGMGMLTAVCVGVIWLAVRNA